jgi:formamidopyrimidine-DNA glycosylase
MVNGTVFNRFWILYLKSKNNSRSIENTSVRNKTTESIQNDSRTRLILVTDTHVAVQYNGPILQFTEDNPLHHESITRLGPDALKSKFDVEMAKERLKERESMKLADLLLDQTFVAGIGNKYKSEILFLQKLWPFNPKNVIVGFIYTMRQFVLQTVGETSSDFPAFSYAFSNSFCRSFSILYRIYSTIIDYHLLLSTIP